MSLSRVLGDVRRSSTNTNPRPLPFLLEPYGKVAVSNKVTIHSSIEVMSKPTHKPVNISVHEFSMLSYGAIGGFFVAFSIVGDLIVAMFLIPAALGGVSVALLLGQRYFGTVSVAPESTRKRGIGIAALAVTLGFTIKVAWQHADWLSVAVVLYSIGFLALRAALRVLRIQRHSVKNHFLG